MKRGLVVGSGVVVLLAAIVVWLVANNVRDEVPLAETAPLVVTPELIDRGAYLVRAGNCMGCHTARGGVPYAGGRGIETPFGTVYASNLTPDAETGLGRWTASEFRRALHNGRSRDGRLLYPAFPYTNYSRVNAADANAIYAYLRSLPPTRQHNRTHTLRFPFDTQLALAVWRAMYFKPERHEDEPSRGPEWNRGAYLVQGLGHCNACHGHRNALGATGGTLDLSGGLIPMQNWYAPSLNDPAEASLAPWSEEDAQALLKTGINRHASVLGPMAEVVRDSTQHLADPDLAAMVHYLRSLPATSRDDPPRADSGTGDFERGRTLYAEHCASCHGERGEGVMHIYPALAGNRAVQLSTPANLVRVLSEGGYAPSTAGNPRPFGMPPFAHLRDEEMAAVLTYIRVAWSPKGRPVSTFDVSRWRERR